MTPAPDRARRLATEALGTALLLAVVVGSGIMGDRLSGGTDGLALLGNTLATAAILVVLITVLGPVSGARFNPAVTAVLWARREMRGREAGAYMAVQAVAALAGVALAHAMFGEPLAQVSTRVRATPGEALSEGTATFVLLLTILGIRAQRPAAVPAMVGLAIAAGYWFTASTSFANPAVTLARMATGSFAGIAPGSVPGFLLAQAAGAAMAALAVRWLRLDAPARA